MWRGLGGSMPRGLVRNDDGHSSIYPLSLSVSRWQLFTRFVEIGRVVLVNYGPDSGKLATVIDVVDGNKVRHLPTTGCRPQGNDWPRVCG